MANELYTYRNGEKLLLKKKEDAYVIRVKPGEAEAFSAEQTELVSSSSVRISLSSKRLNAEMKKVRKNAVAHHAYTLAETGEEFLITDRIFLSFKRSVSGKRRQELLKKYGLQLIEKITADDYLVQLTNETGMNPVKLVVKLTEEEKPVAAVDHDLNQRLAQYRFWIPSDPFYGVQWHLHTHLNHREFDPRCSTRCEDAWRLLESYGDNQVVIGFTDDGCRMDHPDFDSLGKIAGWAYMEGLELKDHNHLEGDPVQMYREGSDHGTNVAGLAAGETDAMFAVGAAPGCRILPVKWEGEGDRLFISDSKLLKVLHFLDDKVDVLFNSWGLAPVHHYNALVIDKIREMALKGGRRKKGVVFVWAAGNENCPVNFTSPVEIPYTNGWKNTGENKWEWEGVKTAKTFSNSLAGLPGVVFVSSISSLAQRSHYANYGAGVDLCAPSNNHHMYMRLGVYGLDIAASSGNADQVTLRFGGTSAAAPLVAGIAGLVISANPGLSAVNVVKTLKRSASKNLNLAGYPKTPPSGYDPDTSWDVSPAPPFDSGHFRDIGSDDGDWSPWFGYGKVDAFEAVAMALRLKNMVDPRKKIVRVSVDNLVIPDNEPAGVISIIEINEEGIIERLEVGLHISHTFHSDLAVTLTSPSGKTIVLHNFQRGAGQNLIREFTPENMADLKKLTGEKIRGKWILQAQDMARFDRGVLRNWYLDITKEKTTIPPEATKSL